MGADISASFTKDSSDIWCPKTPPGIIFTNGIASGSDGKDRKFRVIVGDNLVVVMEEKDLQKYSQENDNMSL